MSRIRCTKPEIWSSEQVVECSIPARLLFIGLWNFCDDHGVHPVSFKRLKMEVFPADSIEVRPLIDELIQAGLVSTFEAPDGVKFWWVTGWKTHQKISHPTYKYPEPPGWNSGEFRNGDARKQTNSGALTERSVVKGIEGNRINTKTGSYAGAREQAESTPPAEAGSGPVAGVFKCVTKEVLADDAKLQSWYDQATSQAKPVVKHSDANRRRVFEAAERAIEHGENPVALFAHIVSKADWKLITQAQEARAVERLKRLDRPPPAKRERSPDADETETRRREELAKLGPVTSSGP